MVDEVFDRIIREFGGNRTGNKAMCKCPCHDDHTPTLKVTLEDGKILVHCYAGCQQKAVVDALKSRGLWPSNDYQDTGSDRPPGVPERWTDKKSGFSGTFTKSWEYMNATGEIIGHVARYDNGKAKAVIPFFTKNGETWKPGAHPEPRPLYGLDRLAANPDAPVLIVEGEKCVAAVQDVLGDDWTVITWPGGCGAVKKADWLPLQGRLCVVWPDADEPGKKAAGTVCQCVITAEAETVTVVTPPAGVAKGWDLADAVAEGWDRKKLNDYIAAHATEHDEPEAELEQPRLIEPLTPEQTRVRLTSKPEPPETLISFGEESFLTRGIVGEIAAAGGTGKGFFVLGLIYKLALAENYGPMKSDRALSILYIGAEDPPAELNRRLWAIGGGQYPSRLFAVSMAGVIGPLMYLQGNEPKRSRWWQWLRDTIKNHAGIDLLILDPKSRIYGLDENSADHATQWIASLEALAVEFNITILFAHHVSKASSNQKLSQHMSRGSSAIADGCRWMLGMEMMDQKTADRYGIENPKQYVCCDLVKSNYAAQLPGPMYFKRTEGGVLKYAALEADRLQTMTRHLVEILANHEGAFTRRQLRQGPDAKAVFEEFKESFSKFDRLRGVDALIDYGIGAGWLREVPEGKTRKIEPQNAGIFDFNQK